jgi:hypothetical protein
MPWFIAALLTMVNHVILKTMVNLVSWSSLFTMINHVSSSTWFIAALVNMVDHG